MRSPSHNNKNRHVTHRSAGLGNIRSPRYMNSLSHLDIIVQCALFATLAHPRSSELGGALPSIARIYRTVRASFNKIPARTQAQSRRRDVADHLLRRFTALFRYQPLFTTCPGTHGQPSGGLCFFSESWRQPAVSLKLHRLTGTATSAHPSTFGRSTASTAATT